MLYSLFECCRPVCPSCCCSISSWTPWTEWAGRWDQCCHLCCPTGTIWDWSSTNRSPPSSRLIIVHERRLVDDTTLLVGWKFNFHCGMEIWFPLSVQRNIRWLEYVGKRLLALGYLWLSKDLKSLLMGITHLILEDQLWRWVKRLIDWVCSTI